MTLPAVVCFGSADCLIRLGRELAPHGREDEVRVGRKHAEVVEVVGRAAVVADRVLELAEAVQERDLLECYLCPIKAR